MTMRSVQSGFSMIEVIISLLILGLLGAAAGHGLQNGAQAFVSSADAVQTLSKLRLASERMTREIREVRRAPATPGVYDITTMSPATFAFTKSDGTGVTLDAAPPIATLAYSSPAGTYTLTDELSSLTFSYLQADGVTPATGNADVVFIDCDLVLSRNGNLYPQHTRVALRNQP